MANTQVGHAPSSWDGVGGVAILHHFILIVLRLDYHSHIQQITLHTHSRSLSTPFLPDITKQSSKDFRVLLEDVGLTLRWLVIIDDKGRLRQITMNDLPVGRSVDVQWTRCYVWCKHPSTQTNMAKGSFFWEQMSHSGRAVPFENRSVINMTGSSFWEQMSFPWRAVPSGNRCAINVTGSSFREQMSYSWRVVPFWNIWVIYEGQFLREHMSYTWRAVPFRNIWVIYEGQFLREHMSYIWRAVPFRNIWVIHEGQFLLGT